MENLVKDLIERDARDSARTAAPLKPSPDAIILDTSEITAEQAVQNVLEWFAKTQKSA